MAKEYAITTKDNPFDPFEQFNDWFLWDETHDHHTTALLGRITRTSEQFSDVEYNHEVEKAIDEIISNDLEHKYVKRVRDVESTV